MTWEEKIRESDAGRCSLKVVQELIKDVGITRVEFPSLPSKSEKEEQNAKI